MLLNNKFDSLTSLAAPSTPCRRCLGLVGVRGGSSHLALLSLLGLLLLTGSRPHLCSIQFSCRYANASSSCLSMHLISGCARCKRVVDRSHQNAVRTSEARTTNAQRARYLGEWLAHRVHQPSQIVFDVLEHQENTTSQVYQNAANISDRSVVRHSNTLTQQHMNASTHQHHATNPHRYQHHQ